MVGGVQVLRSYKQKIQATKPKDTYKMFTDGVVVNLPPRLFRLSVPPSSLQPSLRPV